MVKTNKVNGADFAEFSGDNYKVYSQLLNCAVVHHKYGGGKVVNVVSRENEKHPPLIYVEFYNNEIRHYNPASFSDNFNEIDIPEYIYGSFRDWLDINIKKRNEEERVRVEREAEEERTREEAQKKEKILAGLREKIAPLALRYKIGINKFVDASGYTPLALIILKIEGNDHISRDEVVFLDKNRIYNLLADYFCKEYRRGCNGWDLVKAIKYLRDDGQPEKAIEMSFVVFGDLEIDGAILTTRGGAYRDIGKFAEAKSSAHEAIRIDPESYYPYNLLGAVCYQERNFTDGNKYFNRAIELGGDISSQRYEIRNIFKNSNNETRGEIIKYLEKDPEKYAWIKDFVDLNKGAP